MAFEKLVYLLLEFRHFAIKYALIFICLIQSLSAKGQKTDSTANFIVENMPLYGSSTFLDIKKEVARCFIFPQYAYERGLQGRVFVQFTVDVNKKKGNRVYDIFVVRGVDLSLDLAAIIIVEMLPDEWRSASCRGKDKLVTLTIPITFDLKKAIEVNKTELLDDAILQIHKMDSIKQNRLLYNKDRSTTKQKLAVYFKVEDKLQDFIQNKVKD